MRDVDRERPRVLWVIKGLGPGGAERLLVSLASVADHASFHYRAAYVLAAKDHLASALAERGVETTSLGARSVLDLRWVRDLRRLLVDWRPDIVHAHLPVVASVVRLLVRTLPRGRRPLVVTTEHNDWSTYAWPTRRLNAATASLSDATVAVSEGATASMPPSLRRSTEVIVHGIELSDVDRARAEAAAARASLGVGEDELAVVTVANFREQKDYPNLMRAARTVLDAMPRARFFAIGQGPEEERIRALHGELGLGERFELLGYQPDPLPLVAAADVFVLASRYEGYPVAVMEALALGVPAVVTDVGGAGDAVTDGVEGRLVPPQDHAALASALLEVLGDDELRGRMAQAAAERGRCFDIAAAAQASERIYTTLLSARRP